VLWIKHRRREGQRERDRETDGLTDRDTDKVTHDSKAVNTDRVILSVSYKIKFI
jgi:hypothetical protein